MAIISELLFLSSIVLIFCLPVFEDYLVISQVKIIGWTASLLFVMVITLELLNKFLPEKKKDEEKDDKIKEKEESLENTNIENET